MKLSNNAKLIIFDLDGTLIDTLPDITDSVNFALEEHNLPTYNQDAIMTFVGDGALSLIKNAASNFVDNPDTFDNIFAVYNEHYAANCTNKTLTYNGAPEFIDKLRNDGFMLGILSNKPNEFTHKCVDFYFGNEIFNYVLGSDLRWERKPKPDGLYFVANQLGIDISDCVFVGDSEGDAIASNAAQMKFIGVDWGYQDVERMKKHGINDIADNFSNLYQIIHKKITD